MAQKNLYLNILIISSGLASEAKSISFGTILHNISRTAPPAIRFSSEKKNLTIVCESETKIAAGGSDPRLQLAINM